MQVMQHGSIKVVKEVSEIYRGRGFNEFKYGSVGVTGQFIYIT